MVFEKINFLIMMQNYIILAIAVITAVISQLLFKKGITIFGEIGISTKNISDLIINIFRNPFILIGLISYGISFIVWLIVLSRMKLSVVYPITSMNFILVLLASHYFFGEKLSIIQIGGFLLIIIGVIALARA
jgi:multidrug transporter EmrE-like cation transporter